MTALIGRTPGKFLRFLLGDISNVLREVPVDTIGEIGLTGVDVDLSAIQDAVKGFLSGQPDFEMKFGGPFDTSPAVAVAASAAAPVLSGSHTILQPLALGLVPRSWGIYIGMQAYWETGAPVFGISRSATSGVLVTSYKAAHDGEAMKYTSSLRLFPGSSAPTFGTAAVT